MCKRSVLVIEYEADIREILQTFLSEFDSWKVTLSSSIQEGIELSKIVSPDVILLDASTSESDALLFVEQLKQQSMSKSIPIVLISARANWFSKQELHELGFAGAITKPFKPSTLPAQVTHLLGWNEYCSEPS